MSKPTNSELASIFDSAAREYDDVTSSYAVARRRDILISWARGDCLEVGAGTGEVASALVKAGHHVVATDISPKMVEEIRKKLNIEAAACDAEKLPFQDASFDTVVGAEMIYYLDHPEKFVAEAHRVLKPGGRLLLSSANSTTKFYHKVRTLLRKMGFYRMYFDDSICDFFSERRLKTLLLHNNFKVVTVRKIIVVPFGAFDRLNKFLEKTPLKHFGIFILVLAEK
ncbi:MAG: hypothetical protein A3C80_00790 [Candidatus Ryanbacteria bacterium RIFCSPHIGHO2_02_FULL_45_43]|uniref:Methyltransferase type 11 domain-containing protein n=1 Tax=Candidatus Ryanbacteria bacterium RIFCSPHIGHO2_01_45_13 TaxID=1802112 RepID=A0A1G2FXW5_9BACT|nr:MAG: hypothetical protein A2718_02180 [Candidatus Ryanbacteria bacterium RIFCSPHIGHO2_01_FULL_44_130]OGZ42667.1 MAG: hypothetical protein A2W41_02885 [Candidatus Ryanbacteria bacterium RIFCSPHIGHO2_01_45_13]OGZ48844.1 MAG: hypothetical protein A3C80_00790 [Candidatus Ryanbacteria bacterium RIFCSPHIGHO2_02_FULL_45_43]OGZ50876.1 MAG: hypothetical protein A3E55_02810 [Candidatus Ryanbacteria bacterium RIFCSPHIGHO2_12_FULL_44_20]OGZ52087.1 MAG: hypothetical protein A3A17_01395 [Candidatus Ryanba